MKCVESWRLIAWDGIQGHGDCVVQIPSSSRVKRNT